MTGRTIPELRARLFEKAEELGDAELAQIAREMFRRKPVKRAPVSARKVTPALAAKVRIYAAMPWNRSKSNRDIGRRFKIDGGRVSEILFGKRGEA